MSEEGSDGSPPRPLRRKIKRVMVVSSASESDSDESVIVGSTRRKRMRVVSEASESSSGSSVGARRRRLPALRDSDAGSDSSGWATDHSDAPAAPPRTSGFASDSSEGNSDKCSICLLRFKDQEVGTPETCEHIFCLDCIIEWSKNVNTCPVDRLTFNSIVVRACMGGRVIRTEPVKVVERRSSVDLLVVEEDPTPCEVCGSTEDEENMLLCDGCDLGYHMQCLTPPLTEVPAAQWLCPNCDDLLEVIDLSELNDLFSGISDLELPDGPRMVPLRRPRNVRRSARITRSRSTVDEPSTSSGRRGNVTVQTGGPSTSRGSGASRSSHSNNSTTKRRTAGTQRRKCRRRKTRTVVIEFEVEQGGKFPVTKTVRRKIKKRKVRHSKPE